MRRADYTDLSDYFVQLGPDYYGRAIKRISELAGKAPLFVSFSDDPAWARGAIDLPGDVLVVSHNDAMTAHQDLRLMSLCDHHVIANSTFSWWGAWLNPSPDKIVVSPDLWYAPDWLRSDLIIPESWITVPVQHER